VSKIDGLVMQHGTECYLSKKDILSKTLTVLTDKETTSRPQPLSRAFCRWHDESVQHDPRRWSRSQRKRVHGRFQSPCNARCCSSQTRFVGCGVVDTNSIPAALQSRYGVWQSEFQHPRSDQGSIQSSAANKLKSRLGTGCDPRNFRASTWKIILTVHAQCCKRRIAYLTPVPV
jgi:hypothetical protein